MTSTMPRTAERGEAAQEEERPAALAGATISAGDCDGMHTLVFIKISPKLRDLETLLLLATTVS